MSRVCDICGRGPQVGFSVSHAHNRNKRRWEINLQNMRVLVNGQPKRIKVCTRCIQAGKIERPKFVLRERKAKELDPKLAEVKVVAEVEEEESVSRFFAETSLVDTIFKKKKKPSEDEENYTEAIEAEETVQPDSTPVVVEVERVPDSETFPETEL